MVRLSPKAARFVDEAVFTLLPAEKLTWTRIDRTAPLSDNAARIALSALDRYEHSLRERLETGRLSEDDAADTSNDLGFALAIEKDLRASISR
jgi:hypothetical protein